ncbi:MAG: hypothetical protein JXB15_13965 [Anaerolineales bacterium]|nr:hypothetical protein [Anaerolineales bacterium]
MKQHKKLIILSALALLLLAFTYTSLTSGYDLPWWTLEGGGGGGGCYQSGSGYALCGAAGQPDAGGGSGGVYALESGFWVGPRLTRYRVLLPWVTK